MENPVCESCEVLSKTYFDKLEKVKDFYSDLSDNTSTTAVAEAINKLADALGKTGTKISGGGAGAENRPIVIQLKMPNGRIISESVIRDVDAVS